MSEKIGKWTKKLEWLTEAKRSLWIHLVFLILWLTVGSTVTLLWLSNTVAWVAWMSVYAIVVGHWSGMQAALADLRSPDKEDE